VPGCARISRRSHRSRTTVPAKPVSSHNEADEVLRIAGWPDRTDFILAERKRYETIVRDAGMTS
jgi:hypothetical protein